LQHTKERQELLLSETQTDPTV